MTTSPPALRLRQATTADAEKVAELVREGFRSEAERYGADIPPMREAADDVLSALAADEVVLIAELDERPVGTVRGERAEDGTVVIRRLAVLPEARRMGVARTLMNRLEAEYPQARRFELFTGEGTAPALALYESLGYRRTRIEPVSETVNLVYLEKPIR